MVIHATTVLVILHATNVTTLTDADFVLTQDPLERPIYAFSPITTIWSCLKLHRKYMLDYSKWTQSPVRTLQYGCLRRHTRILCDGILPTKLSVSDVTVVIFAYLLLTSIAELSRCHNFFLPCVWSHNINQSF